MIFSKFYKILLIFSLIFLLVFLNNTNMAFISMNYFSMHSKIFSNQPFTFCLNNNSILFLLMVMLVTCVVVKFSETYMEHYNNFKFFFLLILFFLSMLMLCLSESTMNLMLGWDGLGLTSICLIMFYPNNTTMFNSIMTMFFNRLGDVLLIMAMSIMLIFQLFYYSKINLNLYQLATILMVCSMTKSAQFPLSSWLPAAMSAPTPISAMVHSSTLVTAGIFLVTKMNNIFMETGMLSILTFISGLTFMVGGILANIEKDFKKIIAFSTMSQISMIMFMCCECMYNVAMGHMMFHAFFKTMMFISAGFLFQMKFSDQNFKKMTMNKSNMMNHFMFFIGIFSMTGFLFSSSFYSKDLVIESIISASNFYTFLILIMGSILTIFYSSKLLKYSVSSIYVASSNLKFVKFTFLLLFYLVTLTWGKITSFLMFQYYPMITHLEVIFCLSMITLPLFFKMKIFNFSYALEIFYMKMFSYSIFYKVLLNLALKMFHSDSMNFKSLYLKPKLKMIQNYSPYTLILFFMFLMV